MSFLLRILIFTLITISFGCKGGEFLERNELLNIIGTEKLPEQEDYPDCDAVMLYDDYQVSFDRNGDNLVSTSRWHYVKRVFKNLSDHSVLTYTTTPRKKITAFNARVIKNDGSEYEISSDMAVKSDVNFGDYKEKWQSYAVRLTDMEPGCLVEVFFETSENSLEFRNYNSFQQFGFPIIYQHYHYDYPAGWDEMIPGKKGIIYSLDNKEFDNINKTSGSAGSRSYLDIKIRNMECMEYEPYMPTVTFTKPHINFTLAPVSKWENVYGIYLKERFLPNAKATPKVQEIADKLTTDCKSEMEKINAIYKYVREIRYNDISFEDGGNTPTPCDRVIERDYGDCKDKACLLTSLLKSKGIKAYPVLVPTKGSFDLNPELVNSYFNHVITMVETKDGQEIFLDGTAKYHPLGTLPDMDQGIKVLVLKDENNCIVKDIPNCPANENKIEYFIDISVDKSENVKFKMKTRYYNGIAASIRNFYEDFKDEYEEKMVKGILSGSSLNVKPEEFIYSSLDSVDKPFEVEFTCTADNFIKLSGDYLIINTSVVDILGNLDWLDKDKRIHDIDFEGNVSIFNQVNIHYPSEIIHPESSKIDKNIDYKGLNYHYKSTFEPGTIKVSESFVRNISDFKSSEFDSLRDFYKKSSELSAGSIIFKK